jgi:glucose/arabinose dehydrogenase
LRLLKSKLLWTIVIVLLVAVLLAKSVFQFRGSEGGGEVAFEPPRRVDAADVLLPSGYRAEVVATGLTFPVAVAFDDSARLYVLEAGYAYGEKWTVPRLIRLDPGGRKTEIARGELPPWTGISFANGRFYISEGGAKEPGGRILAVTPGGQMSVVIDSLPSYGDHHTNRPVPGPDGSIYFSIGVATNSGVVGEDNFKFGWGKRSPTFHDIPCADITLAGENFETPDFRRSDSAGTARTGAYLPFGTPSSPGQVIRGAVPCTGSVLRVSPAGGAPELVAWGFRNPFGLEFGPDNALYVTDNGFDIRGSRPVFGGGDHLWRVTPGSWYGWPDYSGGIAVAQERFKPQGKGQPSAIFARPPNAPPTPVARLSVHSSSNGFDFSTNPAFGYVGDAFIAQLGDMTPGTGKLWSPTGFRVVRVNVSTGDVTDFFTNRGKTVGPATWMGNAGIERPVDARFDPTGSALYVTDFGVMTTSERGPVAHEGTGVVWRITRAAGGGT